MLALKAASRSLRWSVVNLLGNHELLLILGDETYARAMHSTVTFRNTLIMYAHASDDARARYVAPFPQCIFVTSTQVWSQAQACVHARRRGVQGQLREVEASSRRKQSSRASSARDSLTPQLSVHGCCARGIRRIPHPLCARRPSPPPSAPRRVPICLCCQRFRAQFSRQSARTFHFYESHISALDP